MAVGGRAETAAFGWTDQIKNHRRSALLDGEKVKWIWRNRVFKKKQKITSGQTGTRQGQTHKRGGFGRGALAWVDVGFYYGTNSFLSLTGVRSPIWYQRALFFFSDRTTKVVSLQNLKMHLRTKCVATLLTFNNRSLLACQWHYALR